MCSRSDVPQGPIRLTCKRVPSLRKQRAATLPALRRHSSCARSQGCTHSARDQPVKQHHYCLRLGENEAPRGTRLPQQSWDPRLAVRSPSLSYRVSFSCRPPQSALPAQGLPTEPHQAAGTSPQRATGRDRCSCSRWRLRERIRTILPRFVF